MIANRNGVIFLLWLLLFALSNIISIFCSKKNLYRKIEADFSEIRVQLTHWQSGRWCETLFFLVKKENVWMWTRLLWLTRTLYFDTKILLLDRWNTELCTQTQYTLRHRTVFHRVAITVIMNSRVFSSICISWIYFFVRFFFRSAKGRERAMCNLIWYM